MVTLKLVNDGDLVQVNRVIESAVSTWRRPQRIKRLGTEIYQYTTVDLMYYSIGAAESDGELVGIAAWDTGDLLGAPPAKRGLLLHGLYVHANYQHLGIGSCLLQEVFRFAELRALDGVLVRSDREATGFFQSNHMQLLEVEDPERDYRHRFWFDVNGTRRSARSSLANKRQGPCFQQAAAR